MTILTDTVWSCLRIAAVGAVATVLTGLGGLGYERARFGATDQAAITRIQTELTERFARTSETLAVRARQVAADAGAIRRARRDPSDVGALFALLEHAAPASQASIAGITVFDPAGVPLAWVGRVSDLPRDRIDGPPALVAALDALGSRLVRIQPVPDVERPPGSRLATIVVEERVDAGPAVSPAITDQFLLPTSVVDVAVRAAGQGGGPSMIPIRAPDGTALVEVEVSAEHLAATRARWRARTQAALFTVLAAGLLMATGPLLERRRHERRLGPMIALTAALAGLMLAARLLIGLGFKPLIGWSLDAPLALLPTALFLSAIVWLLIDVIERGRVAPRRPRLHADRPEAVVRVFAAFGAVGAGAAAWLWWYERVLGDIAGRSSLDLSHFSLHPLEVSRLAAAFGLVLLHTAVLWAAVAIVRSPTAVLRTPRRGRLRIAARAGAIAGAGVTAWWLQRPTSPVPWPPFVLVLIAAAGLTVVLSRPHGPVRRASRALRFGLLFLAVLVPAAAFYPSIHALATASKERTVASTFAPQVARQRDDLKLARLPRSLEAIDGMPSLAEFVTGSSPDAAPTTDRAFIVWSRTELATYRTTSAVELYGPNGRLVSRFALILPEYGTTGAIAGQCDQWELYEEASPFGSTLRPVLRASRAICNGASRVGAIVVRAMLDYRSLPFIAVETPYVDQLRASGVPPREGQFGHDLEFAVYGWSRAPIYAPGTSVWPLPDAVFETMVASRQPVWNTVRRNGEPFRVYFFNDTFGIYALGYPLTQWTDHLINLGELAFLAGVLYVILLLASFFFRRLTGQTPASGRAIFREARSRFYRKLLLGFVASAVVPVVVLAVATRTYLANQFRASVEESATRTATIAQRLVEDYAALQQRGVGSLQAVDDQFMVLVRWAIDQDVNLYAGPRLLATSERDLFASRLLSARTPSQAYRSIVVDRLPTSVAVEDVAGVPYLLAAAPVRTGSRDGIVTVPQPLRGQDIERQRDELDRRVLSASVFFVLLGTAFGYWIAERIADPVNRLTRATRRIARGDLDARVATASSDELRGLIEDFNQMADDLKRQRANLERTQRLEAWADMARQVAHDIKNPLTPIQLSAEHARRLNLDRGSPLSPVLDECVNAILTQVRLLRQISTEFSSFASSPTPRPEAADLAALVEEVVGPYRTGLAGRVAVSVSTADRLPPAWIDKTLFARALTNIIENALHAMPAGGRLGITTSAAAADPERLRVEVQDTGVGMDADALKKVFEPYFSTKASGTGLGLTIAKRNIELIGGKVAVVSERRVGTTVTLMVPIATTDQTP